MEEEEFLNIEDDIYIYERNIYAALGKTDTMNFH